MNFRKARLEDVEEIHRLIGFHAKKGELLPRSRNQLYEHLRNFWVAEEGGRIAGCGALQVTWVDLAEIRSLAIAEEWQGRGIGSGLVGLCLEDASSLGVKKVFALTLPDRVAFFKKHGFHQVPMNRLPHKIWSECIHCIHFPNECKEVAVMKEIAEEA